MAEHLLARLGNKFWPKKVSKQMALARTKTSDKQFVFKKHKFKHLRGKNETNSANSP
jgi:hypothetical protein